MIRFNPYDVKIIDFIDRINLPAFVAMSLNNRASDIYDNSDKHYIYENPFKINLDSEKLYSSDDIGETIYIQEVRLEILSDDFIAANVLKKSNSLVLPERYKIEYRYNTFWTAERISINLETSISKRVVLLMKDNYEILFTGLIDVSENSANIQNGIVELKLYSQNYLLKKIENITVPLFNKSNVSTYGTTPLFGLYTGSELRSPSKIIELYVRESFRYFYYGVNELHHFTFNSIQDANYTSNKIMNVDFAPFEIRKGDVLLKRYYYENSPGLMPCLFKSANILFVLYEGPQTETQRWFWLIKCFFDDDFNMLNPGLLDNDTTTSYPMSLDTTHEYIIKEFRTRVFGSDEGQPWGRYQLGASYGSVELKIVPKLNPTDGKVMNYRISANLPAALDLDICNNSVGVPIKICDLAKAACITQNAYIDFDGIWSFSFKKRDFVAPVPVQISQYDIAIINRKNVFLGRDNFSGLDILNMSNDANDLLKKLLAIDYNKTILKSISEELEIIIKYVGVNLTVGMMYGFENGEKYFIIEIEPEYSPTGIVKFKAIVWKVEESDV